MFSIRRFQQSIFGFSWLFLWKRCRKSKSDRFVYPSLSKSSSLVKTDKLFVLFSLFCFVACDSGKESLASNTVSGKTVKIDRLFLPLSFSWDDLDQDHIQDQFNQLECENCPASFGHLLVKKKVMETNDSDMSVTAHCQGSLINEDLFLTARHCLPEGLEKPGDSCEDNIKIILPRVGVDTPSEIFNCDQVVEISKNYENLGSNKIQPDWVVLKLKAKSNRFLKPEENSSEGINDNETLFGFLPLKDSETDEISITEMECKAIQGSLIFPEFSKNKAPLALLQCNIPVVYGFSGMTLFRFKNEKYFPVGTLSHMVERRDSQSNHFKMGFSNKIIISQILCMTDNTLEFCEFNPEKTEEHEQALFKQSLEKSKIEIDEYLEKWIVDSRYAIQWRSVNSENWKNLPEFYLTYFHRNIEAFQKSFGDSGEVGVSYLQSLIPVYPECVRREFIFDGNQEISVQIPVMQVSLNRVEGERIDTYYEITPTEAHLVPSGGSDGSSVLGVTDRTFIIRFSQGRPKAKFPGHPIVNHRFSHVSAEIPVCP